MYSSPQSISMRHDLVVWGGMYPVSLNLFIIWLLVPNAQQEDRPDGDLDYF